MRAMMLRHCSAMIVLAMAISGCSDLAASGQAPAMGTSDADLVAKADRSFSELTFGMTREDAAPMQLREIIENNCDLNGTCDWLIASAPHVRHAFDENGEVASKRIFIDDYGNGAVRALGIGNHKLKEYVVDAVTAFLPGIQMTCRNVDEAGEGEGRSSCSATVGESNLKLVFADEDVLAEVHFYRFNGM